MSNKTSEIGLIECIERIKSYRKIYTSMAKMATVIYGELYHLDPEFQDSLIASEMRRSSNEINYYNELLNEKICLN